MYQIIAVIIALLLAINYWKFVVGISFIGLIIILIKHFYSSESSHNELLASDDSIVSLPTFDEKKHSRQSGIAFHEPITNTSHWIPYGQLVEIGGYTITDGLIYIVQSLKNTDKYNSVLPFLIVSNLQIEKSNCNYQLSQIDYYPSYSQISPKDRNCYLCWLSRGKRDPEADIGYVFLYFYGLEYRLLIDNNKASSAGDDDEIILAEINKLLSTYEDNFSFYSYATTLISYVCANKSISRIRYTEPVPQPTYHQGLSMDLKIGIGQMARDQIPLSADWALNWYLSAFEPPIYSRTAAKRCYIEFKKLFTEKYQTLFPKGLLITPNKTKLSINYRPANRCLSDKQFCTTFDLPDISVLKKYLNKFAPLIQECHIELDQYSRFLGRNPGKENTLDALLDLSPKLWPDEAIKKFNQLTTDIQINSHPTLIKLSCLLDKLPVWEKPNKTKMLTFLDIIEKHFHIGVEPDCRMNNKMLHEDSNIALFFQKSPSNEDDLRNATYSFATIFLYLNILTAKADGKVSSEKIILLMDTIENWKWIPFSVKPRLKAYTEWLLSQDLKMTDIKKRLENLDLQQKELIGISLIQVTKSDGTISIAEMNLLKNLFKLLNLSSTSLYNHMNQSDFEPITVAVNATTINEYMISSPPNKKSSSEIKIDTKKLTALKAESEKVAILLNDIFEDTEEQSKLLQPAEKIHKEKEHCLGNLSLDLSNFVSILITQPTWTTSELKNISKEHSLMLEGALEEINDKAFDYFNEPLIEEIENGFEINQNVMEELRNE